METLKFLDNLTGHTDRIWNVSWNPNGTLLASCSGDRSIRIWSHSKSSGRWHCVCTLADLHAKTVRCVAWSPCGRFLASAAFDGIVCIERLCGSDPVEFESVTSLASHSYEVKSVSWSASGAFIATCARDKTVHIWDMENTSEPECTETLYAHTQDVKSVKWHPIVDILASASYDNSIKIYREECDEWAAIANLNGHQSTVWNAEFNCHGNILASCSDDKTVRLWVAVDAEFSKWMCASVLDGYHTETIYDLSWAPRSNLLVTVGGDNLVCVLRADRQSDFDPTVCVEYVTTVRQAHQEDVNCCAWQPDRDGGGRLLLATGSDDCSIKLWRFIDPDMPID